jgi:Restriction endonuclease BsobI
MFAKESARIKKPVTKWLRWRYFKDRNCLARLPIYIARPEDLVTSRTRVRDGFLQQALEKTRRVTPHIVEARRLSKALHSVDKVEDVLQIPELGNYLISAAGFSEKAKSHVSTAQLDSAIERVLQEIKAQAQDDFREEIVYRYLLIKGDALGGSMRNITGAIAGARFSDAVIAALRKRGARVEIQRSGSEKIQRIAWSARLLLFDRKPNFVDKNIDCILLKVESEDEKDPQLLARRDRYIACGELKGGIDPAAADEHWKTASTALARIRTSFTNRVPALFFAGAAIELAMAKEIFAQLTDGSLSYAANLTEPRQLADLTEWLVRL